MRVGVLFRERRAFGLRHDGGGGAVCNAHKFNARVDNFWFDDEATVKNVSLRARAYAGAGRIFVPGSLP